MRVLIFLLPAISGFGASAELSSPPRLMPFEARGGVFVSRGSDYTASLTPAREILSAAGRNVSMAAVDANRKATLEPLARMPGRANYFLGRDVRASYDLYGQVRCRNLYPGIDAVFRADQARFEYDFEIAPRRYAPCGPIPGTRCPCPA